MALLLIGVQKNSTHSDLWILAARGRFRKSLFSPIPHPNTRRSVGIGPTARSRGESSPRARKRGSLSRLRFRPCAALI